MWFDTWQDIGRIVAVGAVGYFALVVVLRLSGSRTLSKLNAFDFVVTIALGSTLATMLLSSTVSLAEGFVALWLLVSLQYLVAAVTVRLPSSRRMLTAGPTMLVRDGVPRTDALRRHRVSMAEVRQAVRGTGTGDLSSVAAVVLETDGTLSVIPSSRAGDLSALVDVDRGRSAPDDAAG